MKGIVFSFSRISRGAKNRKRIDLSDFRCIFKRYGVTVIFVILLLFGMILGAMYARCADSDTLNSLDFFFLLS
jgi:hypothetical protein